jgi:hypothetical protein
MEKRYASRTYELPEMLLLIAQVLSRIMKSIRCRTGVYCSRVPVTECVASKNPNARLV